jgi:hypothetical protein
MIEMSKFYTIHRHLKTRATTNIFLEDLTEAENSLFRHRPDDEQVKKFDSKYGDLFSDINIDLSKKDSALKYLSEIKKYFSTLNFMHITVAFPPSEKFFEKMQASLTNLIGFPPVFDVSVDAGTGGGIILDYNGKHLDLSFKKSLERYFTEHRDAILSGI